MKVQNRLFKGFIALLMLALWGPASIASTYAPAKACVACSKQEKHDSKSDSDARIFKLTSASQPAPNHFQVPQSAPDGLACLLDEFAFACPTLLDKPLPATLRSRSASLQQGFFTRLLAGSIAAQAP